MSNELDDSIEAMKRHQADQDDRRQSACDTISCLYPPDSDYPETAIEGRTHLLTAIAMEWRSLPVPILERMAQLQILRDNRSTK